MESSEALFLRLVNQGANDDVLLRWMMGRRKNEPPWNKYLVLRDSREQEGWDFPCKEPCLGTEVATLKTGDYTLKGYEDILSIERKRSTAEFAANIVEARFERELERMDAFKYAFVILEFEVEQIVSFPEGSGIPRPRWKSLKLTPQFIMARLNEFNARYRAKFITVGKRGRELASSLFKRVIEAEKRPCPPNAPPCPKPESEK